MILIKTNSYTVTDIVDTETGETIDNPIRLLNEYHNTKAWDTYNNAMTVLKQPKLAGKIFSRSLYDKYANTSIIC